MQPKIESFRDICGADNLYASLVLVASDEHLVNLQQLKGNVWSEALSRGARTFGYLA